MTGLRSCPRFRSSQTSLLTTTWRGMRGLGRILVALTAAAAVAASDQQVFQQNSTPGSKPAQKTSDKANSTGNLIFWSVSSLLQHWPNNRYINGIVTSLLTLLSRADVN